MQLTGQEIASAIFLGSGLLLLVLPINRIFACTCFSAKVSANEDEDDDTNFWANLHEVWNRLVARHIPTAFKRCCGAVCIYIATQTFQVQMSSISRQAIDNTALIILVLFILLFLLAWVDVLAKYFASRSKKTKTYLDDQCSSFVSNAAKLALVIIAGTTVLESFGVDAKGIIASVGVSSLAIALALQDYVKNIVGLFIIMTDQPFELADHIIVAGVEGFVEKIKFRYTTIKDFSGVRHVLPNSTFIASTVQNFNKQEETKVQLTWLVNFGASSKAIHELREIIYEHLKGGSEPVGSWVDVNVDFVKEGIRFTLSCYYKGGEGLVKTADPNWNFYHEARHMKERILLFIKDAMAQRQIEFVTVPILPCVTVAAQ